MEKDKKRIIYEFMLMHHAVLSENEKMNERSQYGRYHEDNYQRLMGIKCELAKILGCIGTTDDEVISHVTSIDFTITPEQKQALVKLRRNPMFKKLMGETALQQKSELEKVLGTEINEQGDIAWADEKGIPHYPYKTEEQLDQEINDHNDKLSQLLSSGAITEEQYDSYDRNLDYIYSYYISCSKGEQIPFRKMTNAQYEQVEQRAMENGISFSEQLRNETEDLMYGHEEIQELQSQGIRR